jgi:predicted alpha/beta-hydrolase family hydrolase
MSGRATRTHAARGARNARASSSAKVDAAGAREVHVAGRTGLLLRPRGAKALLVLAHGAGAGMRHAFMEALATALAGEKIATLRWEFPYMAAGKKRVDAPEVAEAAVREAVAAGRRYKLPLFAGGKSFGGRMTSRAQAAATLGVKGLVFVGFPLHLPKRPAVERAAHLSAAMGPMLFVQGTRDDLADLGLLRPIVKRIGADLHVIEGADHGFSRSGNIAEVATTIGSWIDRLL